MLAGGPGAPGTRDAGVPAVSQARQSLFVGRRRLLGRGRRGRRRARRVPARAPPRAASERGRGPRVLHQPREPRRGARDRARRAGRRPAPLSPRLPGGTGRPGPDEPEADLGRLRRRERSRGCGGRSPTLRPPDGPARSRRGRGELDDPLPRHLRADVQPLPLHERALASPPPPRAGAEHARPLGGLGGGDARAPRRAALRRARPRRAGRVRRSAPHSAPAAAARAADRARRRRRARRARSGGRTSCSPRASRSASARAAARSSARRSTSSTTCGTSWATSPPAGSGSRSRSPSSARRLRRPRAGAAGVRDPHRRDRGSPRRRAGRGPLRCRRIARDAASHLRPALHGDAVRARSPVARRRCRHGPARRWSPGVLVALVVFEIAWGLDRTRWLYTGEPERRTEAREDAAAWLAETGRADDVLLGFEPTYLDAWEEGRAVRRHLHSAGRSEAGPRRARGCRQPLGRGVWVLDASDELDQDRVRLTIPLRSPGPEFESRAFGPFLIVRTLEPVGDAGVVPRGDAPGPAAERASSRSATPGATTSRPRRR